MRIIAFTFVFFMLLMQDIYALRDSIGIKIIDGKEYIMHQVEQSQGLFAISRRYGVPVDVIKAANDNVENLSLNQIILVPKPKQITKEKKFHHIVEKGETLYKIARLYNVSVDDLIKWNKLEDNAISVGSEILVIQTISYVEIAEPKNNIETPKPDDNEQAYSSGRVLPGAMEVKEEGVATWIEDPSVNSRQALALHKKAPVGTIIKVTNLMNDKEIYVKVVGNIPGQKAHNNEIIRLSKFAARQLKIRDQYTRVKLSYYPENGEK